MAHKKIIKRLKKLVSSRPVKYQAKKKKSMSTMSAAQWRKTMNRGKRATYKIPKRPSSGRGVGF